MTLDPDRFNGRNIKVSFHECEECGETWPEEMDIDDDPREECDHRVTLHHIREVTL